MAATGQTTVQTLQLDQASGSVQLKANASQSGTYTVTFPVITQNMIPTIQAAAITSGYVPYADANGALTSVSTFNYSAGTLSVGSLTLTGTLTIAGAISGATTITCSSTITSTGAGLALSGTITGATTVGLNYANFTSQSASSTDGAVWYDSTQKTLCTRTVGLNMPLGGTMFVGTTNPTAISNAGPSTMIGTGVGTLTIPANFLVAGRSIRVEIAGTISTGSATPTLNVFVKLGATTITTSGAKAVPTSITTGDFYCVAVLTAQAAPSGASAVAGNISFIFNNATATVSMVGSNATTNAATNGSLALDVQCTTAAGTGTTVVTPSMAIVTVIS